MLAKTTPPASREVLSFFCCLHLQGALLVSVDRSCSDGEIQISVSIKCRLQTADCRLQTGYKMQTRYKMQTADCRLGIKCRLRPKLGINCRLRAKLSFRAVGDIFSSLTRPCRVIAFPSSFPRNFLSICIDCEQSMSTDRKEG